MVELTRAVFLLLEEAWAAQDVTLVDFKLEFGISKINGEVRLGDVIDNDSWRIWHQGTKSGDKSKQTYRDASDSSDSTMAGIRDNYAWVADATAQFAAQ